MGTSTGYMNQVNVQFQAIGVRGISILFASGDAGVWGRSGRGSRFNPDFPCGSAFVTAVGGTNFVTDSIGDEAAWYNGGGGFSDTFARPSYQEAAVSAYLKDSSAALPPPGTSMPQAADTPTWLPSEARRRLTASTLVPSQASQGLPLQALSSLASSLCSTT